jgi:uncharacterized ParB-like nuclease family protein
MHSQVIYFRILLVTLFCSLGTIIHVRSTSITQHVDQQTSSIHSASIDDVHNIPMKVVVRPLPSILDENKVQSLMRTIEVNHCHMLFMFSHQCCYSLSRICRSIVFLRLTCSGIKHLIRIIITFFLWVLVIVGSKFHIRLLVNNRRYLPCIFFRAYQRRNSSTIRAKLVRTNLNNLKVYFGSSLSQLT